MTLQTVTVTDLSKLPYVLTLDEVAAVYRQGKGTIRKALQARTFRPAPFLRGPYRWLREDVERDIKRKAAERANAETSREVRRRGRR